MVVQMELSATAARDIPVVDLSRSLRADLPQLNAALEGIATSGSVLLGQELAQFEAEFAAFVGRRFCIGVASGTDALALGLTVLGISPGDEVLVPAFTAVPTAGAVCAVGAVPVPVDVDPATATIDVGAAAAAVTNRTRAVIPVHLYGRPAAIPDLGLPVIEDAAQAHGAVSQSDSPLVCYSFYPTKNLGGIGDGGALLTDDPAMADELRLLRHHGARGGYVHERIAGNSRMSELEAAALRIRLRRLADGNNRRRWIAGQYRKAAPGLRWQKPHEHHAYHLCVARVTNRDAFRVAVSFQTAVHYPRSLAQQPAYAHFRRHPTPEADAWASECVSLPCFPELSDEEVARVSASLAQVAP
jgi:dTDP-4-amino-4,6-dideoxygalactose transaminase